MGFFVSKFFKMWEEFASSEARVTMLGLDGAGKTTILYWLKLDRMVTTIPTIGFNVEIVKPCQGLYLTIFEPGSPIGIRQLWHHYCMNIDDLVFVLDSRDEERFEEAKNELHRILDLDSVSKFLF